MNEDRRLSESLHRSLDRRADAFSPDQADMAQIVHRARGIRRRRRTAVSALAAAAVAVVAVPTALTLGGGPQAGTTVGPAGSGTASTSVSQTPTTTPTSTPSTTAPSPSPTAQPLSDIPMGSPLEVTYVFDGTVHYAGGGTAQLPGDPTGVSGFTSYHGGWLVVDQDANTITQYDNAGNVVRSGSNGVLAVSGATTQTAFQMDSTIRVGTPMGELEQEVPAPPGGLAGLLSSGVVYNTGGGKVMLADYSGHTQQVPVLIHATTTYVPGDLVGGTVDQNAHGAVVSVKTGKVVWQNEWWPLAFSQDGKYVAAVPARDNGDAETVAILDARTGEPVAQMPLLDNRRYLAGRTVVFGHDDSALFPVDDASGHQTVVRLTTDDTVTRTTPIVRTVGTTPGYVFATQP